MYVECMNDIIERNSPFPEMDHGQFCLFQRGEIRILNDPTGYCSRNQLRCEQWYQSAGERDGSTVPQTAMLDL